MTDLSALRKVASQASAGDDVSYDAMQEMADPETVLRLLRELEAGRALYEIADVLGRSTPNFCIPVTSHMDSLRQAVARYQEATKP